jgi:hypothetical protein
MFIAGRSLNGSLLVTSPSSGHMQSSRRHFLQLRATRCGTLLRSPKLGCSKPCAGGDSGSCFNRQVPLAGMFIADLYARGGGQWAISYAKGAHRCAARPHAGAHRVSGAPAQCRSREATCQQRLSASARRSSGFAARREGGRTRGLVLRLHCHGNPSDGRRDSAETGSLHLGR